MGAFFVYIAKSAVCLAVFYLFYRLLLSKETFHRFNRIALLGILVLSCVIPLVEVTVKEPMEVGRQFLSLEELLLMADLNSDVVVGEASSPVFTWREGLLVVYMLGIVFFFLRNLWSLGRMLRLIRNSRVVRQEGGIVLIAHRRDIAPFSWMKFVVLSEKDLEENGREILTHEYAHIHKHHSIDLLIADVCIFFQWFNPASWLLKQELQNIHEYEADESVISQGVNAKEYQLLLIKKAVGTRLYSMANSFNHSSLKKRITMMLKEKSSPWARLKYFYVLPLAAVAVAAFARPEVSNELDEISSVKVNDLAAIMKADEVKSAETVPNALQEKKIKLKGMVRDKEREPIVGASILVKGTTNGTVTGRDGSFTLEVPENSTLVCSFVGYRSKEISVSPGMSQVDAVLEKEKTSSASPAFRVVEDMPEFPGGMAECLKFLSNNIKYPAEAQQAGVQGRVIVKFVVEKDGTITNPKVMRSVNADLNGEAIRVISIMPKWKPGMQKGEPVRAQFTLPISFDLSGKESTPTPVKLVGDGLPIAGVAKVFNVRGAGEKVMVVIDNVECTQEAMQKLSPDKIESVSVLKDDAAVSLYGEKAKDGVIVITTKK